ncbi:acetoacetate decarboxylase family protein [Nocardioides marinus]|uniref:Acetoacetate decarboxylase (ADC) n=1 Tax=Nocardioides marinus TaxID=374514 RepID=A0A7Y9YCJ1_9ACTN|nr:hypothetical protein [Nocardioides marinus]
MTAQQDPHRPAEPADRPYPPEPWDLTGTGAITTWRVPVGVLPELPSGVRAAAVRGTALVTTAFVRYDDRGLMAYDELLAAVLVRHGRGVALSITDIWVDSETSVAGGRGLWGIPKDLATFGEHFAETADGPIAAASFSARRGPAVRLPLPLRGAVVQTLDGRTVASPIRAGGTVRPARATWDLAEDGPLAWLRGGRPVTSLLARDFSMRFGS